MDADLDVVVLRGNVHGLSLSSYASALEQRLEGCQIHVARTPDQEMALIERASIATGFRIDPTLLARADRLELFACAYAGTGHLPLEALEEAGVTVTNASGVHGPNMAEHVIGAMLAFTRRFHVGARRQARREWRSYQTHELQGSTVTVVGLGAIGRAVCSRLEPFGVDLLGVRYSPGKGGPVDDVYGFDEIHEPLSRSEYVVLACPLTDETEGLIDADALRTLPSSAVLINVARGPVIETDALVSALQHNGLRGASLDVTDPEPLPETHPLWTFDNVQITPHNSGYTPAYYDRLADILARNVDRIRETGSFEALENQVIP